MDTKQHTTPMMQHYIKIKKQYPEHILLYQMGDFFEMFFDDAIKVSQALSITLTKRGNSGGNNIPMCGIPLKAYTSYLSRLIKAGFKVAICEQTENPKEAKKRGSSSVVNRQITRIVTQGTLTEEELLNGTSNNYIMSVAQNKKNIACSWLDLSIGEFNCQNTTIKQLGSLFTKVNPSEILLSENLIQTPELYELFSEYNNKITTIASTKFNLELCKQLTCQFYNVQDLQGLGSFSHEQIIANGVLLDYILITQKQNNMYLSIPKIIEHNIYMDIDSSTRRSLELCQTQQGKKSGSLLDLIDNTKTPAGARLLTKDMSNPLKVKDKITNRLNAVDYFVNNIKTCTDLQETLLKMPDLERALTRLSLNRGTPQDLNIIKIGLLVVIKLKNKLSKIFVDDKKDNTLLNYITTNLIVVDNIINLLEKSLKQEDLPNNLNNGGYIAKGFNEELDKLNILRFESNNALTEMQQDLQQKTQIPKLKISSNNIWGYFIEVPSKFSEILINDSKFVHRQTMVSSVRFSYEPLSILEQQINNANEKGIELEHQIFNQLVQQVFDYSKDILLNVRLVSRLDVTISHATYAINNDCCKPTITTDLSFNIKNLRHPIVENSLKAQGKDFIPNSCKLEKNGKIWLITGPNMAGKSTFLRQNALVAVLAQMGSFIPASSGTIGIVDKLFSRVGASDNISAGQSTFMVEMLETARIVNEATKNSLVILDEVGRGTATYDGLAIAWAVIEQLHEVNKCRTMFATHYHEITHLEKKLANIKNVNIKVTEQKNKIVFLHKIIEGCAKGSYGIHVAKIAGIPSMVTNRATEILNYLENNDKKGNTTNSLDKLPLFNSFSPLVIQKNEESSELQEYINNIDIDNLTPKEALNTIYELQEKFK